MINYNSLSVAEIVLNQPNAVTIFEEYHIDFCCKGKLLLSEACSLQNVDVEKIEKLLNEIPSQTDSLRTIPVNGSINELVDYVINRHHYYFWKQLPLIKEHMIKVINAHGEHHPFLADLKRSVNELLIDLEQHMLKEEQVLFPYFKELSKISPSGNSKSQTIHFLKKPITMMEIEHERAGELLEQIRKISSNFTPPPSACTTFKLLYTELEAFERDLHQHIFVENTILFPKGLTLEVELTATAPM